MNINTGGGLLHLVLEYAQGDTGRIYDGVARALRRVTHGVHREYLGFILPILARIRIDAQHQEKPNVILHGKIITTISEEKSMKIRLNKIFSIDES